VTEKPGLGKKLGYNEKLGNQINRVREASQTPTGRKEGQDHWCI
jgi:hypothetical protein